MQLVAFGAQDVYLTGSPQVTYFRSTYRRHTNFSCEPIEQTFSGPVDFGRKANLTVSRNGDLISKMYLQVTLPDLVINNASTGDLTVTAGWQPYVGLRLINYIEVELGGQRMDKHYGEWMLIWHELTCDAGKQDGYDTMTGAALYESVTISGSGSHTISGSDLYIPIEFWFTQDSGLALPLIALQYHELKVSVDFHDFDDCTYTDDSTGNITFTSASLDDASLMVDYIYLDTDERRRTAQYKHETIITQLQHTGSETLTAGSNRFTLQFNHPCKELVWVCSGDSAATWNDFSDQASGNPVTLARLQLNGHDRLSERAGDYFSLVQPYQHHTNVPTSPGINVYSFALYPENASQPSGSCNMSRIDNAVLNMTSSVSGTCNIYATSWNVLRVLSGMGGLAYAN